MGRGKKCHKLNTRKDGEWTRMEENQSGGMFEGRANLWGSGLQVQGMNEGQGSPDPTPPVLESGKMYPHVSGLNS